MRHVIDEKPDNAKSNFKKLTVADWFVDDHKYILDLTYTARERVVDLDEVLKKLDWYITRHFYLEEKALYSFINLTQITPKFLKEFIKQHNSLILSKDHIISKIKEKPEELKLIIIDYIAQISSHVSYEITNVYSFIEENINEDQKENMVNEIQKDISLGFYPIEKLRSYYNDRLNLNIPPLES